MRSAFLYMAGDAAASAGVILGGIIIAFTGWYIIDPILSIAISLLIAAGAWRLLRETVSILMEGAPADVDFEKAVGSILATEGVRELHDLHIWSITKGNSALSCHVVVDGSLTVDKGQEILRGIEHKLLHLGIGHVTVQFEDVSHPHKNQILCAVHQS